MTNQFNLIQMSFDGSFVTDSQHDTLEGAQNTSAEMGSKWYFYPLSVITKRQTIIETGGMFCNMQTGECLLSKRFAGKRLKTIVKTLKQISVLPEMENAGWEEYEIFLLNNFIN